MAKVTRLGPTKDTLRELYLKSGNQCAYPGCIRVMINSEGNFVGQVCHIEAAEEGGQRFNPNQSPEDRRAFPNLLLMCYEHHVITNDVDKFKVPVLQQMKAEHEAKFTDIAKVMKDAIADKAAATEIKRAVSLKVLMTALKWSDQNDEDTLKSALSDVGWAGNCLRKLPIRTRQLLAVIVSRLRRIGLPNQPYVKYRYNHDVLHREIAEACDLTDRDVVEHVRILDRYGIASGEDGENGEPARIVLRECPSGWFLWGDLKEFSRVAAVPLHSILVDLRFDLLD